MSTLSAEYKALKIIGLLLGSAGLALLVVFGALEEHVNSEFGLYLSLGMMITGVILYSLGVYIPVPKGIQNNSNWDRSLTNRGLSGYIAGIAITGFYILLYWFPEFLGQGNDGSANSGLVALFDPLSYTLKGQPASQWFVYGVLYTLAILAFGIKFILKYRHDKYQVWRTLSVMFFQTGFAFLIPELLLRLNYPYNDMKNMWPLNYYFFDEWNVRSMIDSGNVGLFMIVLGVTMIFIVSPILTYLYGKRWYCSWVCGCGGLAETAGDPFRHLSDKRLKAWKVERWMIHGVLLFSFVMTAAVIYTYLHNDPQGFWISKEILLVGLIVLLLGFAFIVSKQKSLTPNLGKHQRQIFTTIALATVSIMVVAYFMGQSNLFFIDSYQIRSTYGFFVGAAFSGVIGVGFYPILGSRVWCRFGCPMAAILGIQQKWFSRFRITTNGGQCISCGNCSTYCEMGIDVRSYAQKGQNIVRASCVGCGICASVCPRGVLRLENGSVDIFERTTELKTVHVPESQVGKLN